MAKKTSHNPPKPKEFRSTPFGQLKNVTVAEAVPVQQAPPETRKTVEPVAGGRDLFLQAMADVTPLTPHPPKKAGQRMQETPAPGAAATKKTPPAAEIADELFLQEIGRLRLDTKFADSVPDDGEMKPLSGNRLRQVKRGIVSVDHQLDLHGLSREEALAALPGFLKSAQQRGQKAALVITGKGNHSAEEPVLQQAVASWLRDAGRNLVAEYAPAPREMGGSGAFVVFLRSG